MQSLRNYITVSRLVFGSALVAASSILLSTYISAPPSYIQAHGTVIHSGGRSSLMEVSFIDSSGRLVYAEMDGLASFRLPGSQADIFYNPADLRQAKLKLSPLETIITYGMTYFAVFALYLAGMTIFDKYRRKSQPG